MESEYYGGDQSGSGAGAFPAGGTPGALGPVRESAGHGGDRFALPSPALACPSRGRLRLPGPSALAVVSRSGGGVVPGAPRRVLGPGRAGRLRPGGSRQPAPQGLGVTSAGPGRVRWRDRSTAVALLLVRCFDWCICHCLRACFK